MIKIKIVQLPEKCLKKPKKYLHAEKSKYCQQCELLYHPNVIKSVNLQHCKTTVSKL